MDIEEGRVSEAQVVGVEGWGEPEVASGLVLKALLCT